MGHYMVQFKYGPENFRGLVQNPENRTEMVRQAMEGFGGRLHAFFYTYGEYDGVVLAEFADGESCLAFCAMIASKGGFAASKTTVLIDPDEARRAFQRAGETKTSYRPATT